MLNKLAALSAFSNRRWFPFWHFPAHFFRPFLVFNSRFKVAGAGRRLFTTADIDSLGQAAHLKGSQLSTSKHFQEIFCSVKF
jgi:hypothetical protein